MRFTADTSQARAKLKKIKAGLTKEAQDKVIRKVALVTHARMVSRTPKGYTGGTRRAWEVIKVNTGYYRVKNDSKTMKWLEAGTKAHGPVTAKFLFIPLNRKTALAGAKGVFRANRAVALNRAFGGTNAGARRTKYKLGRDFLLVKRVRGITAMRIVAKSRGFVRITLKAAMRLHIRHIVNS